jgi:uncharacterized protein YndB with AHSA1/START domain
MSPAYHYAPRSDWQHDSKAFENREAFHPIIAAAPPVFTAVLNCRILAVSAALQTGRRTPMSDAASQATALTIERVLNAPRAHVWRCWTEPALITQWFCPRPWKTVEARVDLRPGGEFYTKMRGPDGEEPSGEPGVFLDVVKGERLVFTDAFKPGWIPAQGLMFVATIEMADAPGGGTLYRATARHWTAEAAKAHEDMGFHPGWNAAADQLEELAARL